MDRAYEANPPETLGRRPVTARPIARALVQLVSQHGLHGQHGQHGLIGTGNGQQWTAKGSQWSANVQVVHQRTVNGQWLAVN